MSQSSRGGRGGRGRGKVQKVSNVQRKQPTTSTPVLPTKNTFSEPTNAGFRALKGLSHPDKRHGPKSDYFRTTEGFVGKYNQYLDSRATNDPIDISFIKNATPEDLYVDVDEDLNDDEIMGVLDYDDDKVDQDICKTMNDIMRWRSRDEDYKKRRRAGEYIPKVTKPSEGNRRGETFNAPCKPTTYNLIYLDSKNRHEKKGGSERPNLLKMAKNPYTFFDRWRDQGKHSRIGGYKRVYQIACVTMKSGIPIQQNPHTAVTNKGLERARTTLRLFNTSTRFLNLKIFFDNLKGVPIKGVSKEHYDPFHRPTEPTEMEEEEEEKEEKDQTADFFKPPALKKKKVQFKEDVLPAAAAAPSVERDPTTDTERIILDCLKDIDKLNEKIRCEETQFKLAKIFKPVLHVDHTTGRVAPENPIYFACSQFMVSIPQEDMKIDVYVYYIIDFRRLLTSVGSVFYCITETG